MIRLYADENVDDRIIRGLRRQRADVVTVVEAGMTGKPDSEQLTRATVDGRVLLTSDQDFLDLHRRWMREGKAHAGIIYYSQFQVSVGACIRGVKLVLDLLSHEEMKNQLEFIAP